MPMIVSMQPKPKPKPEPEPEPNPLMQHVSVYKTFGQINENWGMLVYNNQI